MEKEKEKVYIIGLMEINMKEILKIIKEKKKESVMEINMKEIIKMI